MTGHDPGGKRKPKDLILVKVPSQAHVFDGAFSYHTSTSFLSIPAPATAIPHNPVLGPTALTGVSVCVPTDLRVGAFYIF